MENPVTPARGTQKPMIRLKHVSKTFTDGKDGVKALVDVNLDIMPGDIFGIIGLFRRRQVHARPLHQPSGASHRRQRVRRRTRS